MELNANLNLYRYFVVVYNARNFTRASEILSIGVPAVFRGIKELEKQVNAKLFVSLPRGVVPTKEADDLYKMVSPALNTLFKAEELINSFDETSEGTIRIACTTNFASDYLAKKIVVFNKQYPKIKFDILHKSSDDAIELLKKCDIDFIVTNIPFENNESFNILNIETLTRVFFASKDFAEKHKITPLIDKTHFEKLPFISLRKHGKKYFGNMNSVSTVESMDTLVQLVSHGLGIGECLEKYFDKCQDNSLIKFAVNGVELKDFYLVIAYDKTIISKAAKTFISSMRQ